MGRRSRALMVGLGLLLALLPGTRAVGSGPEAARLAAPLGTGITYQGFLEQNSVPANGTFPMQFQLFDAATGGTQIGPTLTPSVVVTNGQFTVPLEFGPGAFNGEGRWLAITVQGTLLSPRQEVRAAPYALALGGLRTEPNATSPNVIGGSSGNSVTVGVVGATIGGGGWISPGPNRVTDEYGTVGGGAHNRAGDNAGTTSDRAFATVGGGWDNTASGDGATVGGGWDNTASGLSSFAAGVQARALGAGTFVWNDSNPTGAPFASDTNLTSFGSVSTTDSFHVRATGGVRFVTSTSNNAGPYVNPGGTAWNAGSHSSLKTDFTPVDTRAVLEGLVGLPLTTWRLRDEAPGVRHLGPMAEDFFAAFGLGDGDRAINTLDADGVAFAAIQGLYRLVQEQAALLAALQAEHAALQEDRAALAEQVRALAARLAAVEQAGAAGEAP